MKIIGAGLHGTHTTPLVAALGQLGIKPIYTAEAFCFDPERARLPGPDYAWLSGYEATMQTPAAYFWRELAEYFPEAKILLSVSDPDERLDAVEATASITVHRVRSREYDMGPVEQIMAWGDPIEGAYDTHTRAEMIERYLAWNQNVRDTAPSGRLVEWHPEDGWDGLCAALGVPIPMIVNPPVRGVSQTLAVTKPIPFPTGQVCFPAFKD